MRGIETTSVIFHDLLRGLRIENVDFPDKMCIASSFKETLKPPKVVNHLAISRKPFTSVYNLHNHRLLILLSVKPRAHL